MSARETETSSFRARSLGAQLDQICDRFEAALRAGERPVLEDYWRQIPGGQADLFQALLRLELAYRRKQGEPPSRDHYAARFAEQQQIVDEVFATPAPTADQRMPPADSTPASRPQELSSDNRDGCSTANVTARLSYISEATIGDQRVGRYRLDRLLGEGTFGKVWLGFDEELQRQVAIKVPTPEQFHGPEDAEAYLAEARTLAWLDHPHIVSVYDVGRTHDGSIYVVSKFVAGCNLAERIQRDRPSPAVAADLMATVARALHHAHQKRLIHRDIKPANILIEDRTGNAFVADFGLAISEEDYLRDGKLAGTPAYMSPEQARGEGHRLDGRSDLFSLGVVLYELLTGKRPFRGNSVTEVLLQIKEADPLPPRDLDATIPTELERICLRALSKRASDRYANGAELADDLAHWPQGPQLPQTELQVVPKGLRSFDAGDADFFLQLLPGPRNRDGLPESIQFWKTRLEESDPDRTFSVGLLYGPSGCGKSSLVKAGLLPRLSNALVAVYVEATPDDTEARILRGLRKHLPDLPHDLGLAAAFAALRRREGKKVVVVLDQFEQWLHAHRTEQKNELVDALRQCDGGRVQAVVMVRDDFAMAAARFMDALDIRIVQGHNFATVDLFDTDHAQKVLTRFGQAFDRLPAQLSRVADDQKAFLVAVSQGLARDGKVVSVRLSLFAEMVKGKPWVPATLDEVGGTEGIGINFLDETFSSRTANPQHRLHQQAARAVLKSLLPEVGTDIKGHMRSHAELLAASGYQIRPEQFDELLRILDGELRLITPTDPEDADSMTDPQSVPRAVHRYYQLTHDYLVPALHDWLTRKQKETRRGRAELRLAGLSAQWSAFPASRQLPVWWEWLNIRLFTRKKTWTLPQKKMMAKADRYHATRGGVVALLVFAVVIGGLSIRAQSWRSEINSALDMSDRQSVVLLRDELHRTKAFYLKADELYEVGAPGWEAERLAAAGCKMSLAQARLSWANGDAVATVTHLEQAARFGNRMLEETEAAYEAEQVTLDLLDNAKNGRAMAHETLDRVRYALQKLGYNLDDSTSSQRITDSILLADNARDFRPLAEAVRPHWKSASPELRSLLTRSVLPTDPPDKWMFWKRQANAAACLVQFGEGDAVWPLLKLTPNPSLRSYIIDRLALLGVDLTSVADHLAQAEDPSIRQALILALGHDNDHEGLPSQPPQSVVDQVLTLYRTDADPGIHSAAAWALRQWHEPTSEFDAELRNVASQQQKNWYVNSQGQTFIVVNGPVEFQMGGVRDKQTVRPSHRFAVAAYEVTEPQFQQFRPDYKVNAGFESVGDCPVNGVSWYDAVEYCNWLSEKEGIPQEQWCYQTNAKGEYAEGMKIPRDFLQRSGYRLPTEPEWEFICCANTTSVYSFGECNSFGESIEPIGRYACYRESPSSFGRPFPVGQLLPNGLGFFDVHGNVEEWCHNLYDPKTDDLTVNSTDAQADGRVLRGGSVDDLDTELSSYARRWRKPAFRDRSNNGTWCGFRAARTYP